MQKGLIMRNGKGIYKERIEIVGELSSYQGNEIGLRNWLKKLNKNPYKVVVKLVSEDKATNELLERVLDLGTTEIRFPWRDIPEQPKCNGTFNRVTGEIDHYHEHECPIHSTPKHTHIAQDIREVD